MEAATFHSAVTGARLRDEATARCDELVGYALALRAGRKLRCHGGRNERGVEAMRATDLARFTVARRKCRRVENGWTDVRARKRSGIRSATAVAVTRRVVVFLAELADA